MKDKKDLIIDLCKRIINGDIIDSYGNICEGIDCIDDNCPFSINNCSSDGTAQLKIAKKYLKDNEMEDNNKMEDEVYKGWEIIKMCEERKFENGTVLEDLDGDCYTIFDGVIIKGKRTEFNSNYEITSSFLTRNKFRIPRKQYKFNEAFKAFEKWNEIESCVSGVKYKKVSEYRWKYNSSNKYSESIDSDIEMFAIDEVRGEWYINE